jgi:hypothetical protein
MPFTFIIVGLFLIIAAARGKSQDLFDLLHDDFVSTQDKSSFLPWVVSILVVGSLGYVPQLRTFSRTFLVLLILVLFLSNKGFFAKLKEILPEVFGKATGSIQ